MPDTSARAGWLLPVLLAVTTSTTLGLGYLYLARPNAGELGSVRVVVAEDGKGPAANGITVHVAEAPFVQRETVSPGPSYTGVVNFPRPYRLVPHLKVTPAGKRKYEMTPTATGFTWVAQPLPEDYREDARKDENALVNLLGLSLAAAQAREKLKPGLVFEDFTWEAKGVRLPPSALPPQPFEQTGKFYSMKGQEAVIHFPVPYDAAPNVTLGGHVTSQNTLVVECTPTGFKWRHTNPNGWEGEVTWTARGLRTEKK